MGITEYIAERFANYDDPNSLGSKLRARRVKHLVAVIDGVHRKKGEVNLMDIGGRKSYWNILPRRFLEERKLHITVLNLPCEAQPENDETFTFVKGNACSLKEYSDNSFDIVHSNSVIEHVGNWENMKSFAKETRRLAPNIYAQTPYFWFPIEPHYMTPFFHWIPWQLQLSLISRFTLGNRGKGRDLDRSMINVEDVPRLLTFRLMRHLFPDCEIVKEKILVFTKSLTAIRTEAGVNKQ